MGSVWSRLGTKVTVVEALDRLFQIWTERLHLIL
ncbi:MAG: hypothetical protein CM1200mP13_03180 [Candidatus Pelagibacterales bacterium]|nr:MAG: hypothetical protein CM1200mP13_03180 [Pelagibacterales bacterium]